MSFNTKELEAEGKEAPSASGAITVGRECDYCGAITYERAPATCGRCGARGI